MNKFNNFLVHCLIAVSVSAFSAFPLPAQKTETGFLDRSVVVNKTVYRYQVYVPRDFTRSKTWPVIIALHGGGTYGNDGIRPTEGGLGRIIRSKPGSVPAIVIFPQAHADGKPGWQLEGGAAVVAALDRSIREFKGDAKRVVLAGYSAGGNGTWSIAMRYPERFAAIVPICGFVVKFKGTTSGVDYAGLAPDDAVDPYMFVAKKVFPIPVWIFHGDADKTVPPDESRKMYAALRSIGANVEYTELTGVPHNAWDPSFERADLIEWMLKQKRP